MYMIDVLQFRRILSDAIEGIYSDEDIAERIYSKICKSMEDDFYDEGHEVVKCKDCKYAAMTIGGQCKYCSFWSEMFDANEQLYLDGNDFCSNGERKEQE